ncbi:efflux transporter outer membrane subunit [Amphritea opalescens]|uniref:Efflux transporter outer membrane subunit n=1 Tax=Amphritea opalescens TaxID=2490544 RepID=A0A430KVL5_9GAMM|nr:efflux transporter outer membrane subunit [Amphritea opalescens]RTE67404.1 efflux transporter outer membrane subunit [Amphritea opalescens]
MKTVKKNAFVILSCVFALSGCSSMRSDYQSPVLEVPQSWSQTQVSAAVVRPDAWWTLFDDPQLNRLVDQVLVSNNDLATATLTLKKARLAAGVSENNKVPSINAAQSSAREYDLDSGTSASSFGLGLSLAYELDLWGRVDAVADAAEWTANARYEDRENTAHNLVVTTAMLYWKVAYLRQVIALSEQNITDTERVVRLTQSKYDVGAESRLAVLESTQSLYNQRVELSQLQQTLSETQNAIGTLLNQPLQASGISVDRLPTQAIPDIEAGVPADLLLRRPDVKASLYALKSSLASQDAVDASYMPTFTLTGALNTSSSSLLNVLHNPVATLGNGIVLPFLEWQKMTLNKDIAEVDYQLAVVDYRDTLYQAFEEVANLLMAKQNFDHQGNIYRAQYENAQAIEAIYGSRYQQGETDIIDWLGVMESRRSIETSLLENRYNQFVIQAKLYQSLGGGDIAPEVEG